jgi:RNA polymerase sigma factor (sigma-70 family)
VWLTARVSGAAAGTKGAGSFDDFYRREMPRLIVFARRMGATWEEAGDAAQDAMTEAFARWQEIASPRAWVRVVAGRKFIDSQKRSQQDTEIAQRSSWAISGCYTPPEVPEEAEVVLKALGQLPLAQRQVMAWTIDGYAPAEIAVMLGCSASTVRSNLRHARIQLAKWLADGGAT